MNKKKIGLLFSIAALLAGGVFFFFGSQGVYFQHRQLQHKAAEIAADRRVIDSLQREIKRLSSDTAAIERLAREKLGMAKPNEKVYKFVDKRK